MPWGMRVTATGNSKIVVGGIGVVDGVRELTMDGPVGGSIWISLPIEVSLDELLTVGRLARNVGLGTVDEFAHDGPGVRCYSFLLQRFGLLVIIVEPKEVLVLNPF